MLFRSKKLLRQNEGIFSKGEHDIGRTQLIEYRIDTGDHRPIRQPLRRQPFQHLEIIDKQVKDMKDAGIIESVASPWASNVVLVKKRDGSLRFCVDYRRLNAITYKDSYPLPLIDNCLNALSGSSWCSTLDLRSGYYNIPIAEEDRDKSSFITRTGCFRFTVMPFGLTCAPSVSKVDGLRPWRLALFDVPCLHRRHNNLREILRPTTRAIGRSL